MKAVRSLIRVTHPTRFLKRASILGVLMIATIAFNTPVQAATGGDGLEPSIAVVELYFAKRPYDKTPLYATQITEHINKLGKFSLLERADARQQITKRMLSSSRRVTDDKLKEIEGMMKEGDRLLLTNPRQAIEILAKAKKKLKMVMGNISLNHRIRKEFFRTQMRLVRAYVDNENPDKAATILEEVIRVFGDDAKVTDEEYHPKVVALYKEAYRRMSEVKRGQLLVRTLPAGAEVLIHGRKQNKPSPATFEGLYPGSVAVQARKGGRESMVHKVKIAAGQTREITIDIDYENSLSFNDKQFGFIFPDRKTLKSRIADFGSRVGKMLKVDYVLAVGLVEIEGRTYLEGYLLNVNKTKIAMHKRLTTKANVVSKYRVREMATVMSGKSMSPIYKPWFKNWVGWTGVGVGVIGLAMGAAFASSYSNHLAVANCDPTKPGAKCLPKEGRLLAASDAKTASGLTATGFILAGLGAIGGTLAFILMKTPDPNAQSADTGPVLRSINPIVLRNGGGVGAAFSF